MRILKKIAVISAILEEPKECQERFNNVVSSFRGSIKGRMGIPFEWKQQLLKGRFNKRYECYRNYKQAI